MRKKKLTRRIKKTMFGDRFDPNSESNYARKMKLQGRGIFSIFSPLKIGAKSTYDPSVNKPY